MINNLLEIKNLKTSFNTDDGIVNAVNGVDFIIKENEILGVVGESGCGKSVTSLSIMQLLDVSGDITNGEIIFGGENLLKKSAAEMRKIRGNDISMIFQEPMTSLNPVYPVGDQIIETLKIHQKLSKRDALHRAVEMLELVGIPDPEIRVHEYPHQLSGGMRQRIMIAIALACSPKLLIADEPTTALDVTIQAQIIELMQDLKKKTGSSVMIITHDLGVIAEIADNVVVMYAGRLVEYAPVRGIFEDSLHPYTSALLDSIPRLTDSKDKKLKAIEGSIPNPRELPGGCSFHPRCRFTRDICRTEIPHINFTEDGRQVRCWKYDSRHAGSFKVKTDEIPDPEKAHTRASNKIPVNDSRILLEVKNLKKYFPIKGGVFRKTIGQVHAVDDVSFFIREGETLGLVGESGCGKTTTGRLLLRLLDPTNGSVMYGDKSIYSLKNKDMRDLRKDMQIIFQDPYASLNPRMTVESIIAECYSIHGKYSAKERREHIAAILKVVGLQEDHMFRYPHQFSGGQRQRIGIARAIALKPKLIVCDEPVSALDVSIQAQIINLLEDLQEQMNLTYLFIAHDLSVVKHISDRVAVMYLGQIVEIAETNSLYNNPQHPYTEALMSAVPIADTTIIRKERIILEGDVPSPRDLLPGCRFHSRCRYCMDVCRVKAPALTDLGNGHFVSCHLRS